MSRKISKSDTATILESLSSGSLLKAIELLNRDANVGSYLGVISKVNISDKYACKIKMNPDSLSLKDGSGIIFENMKNGLATVHEPALMTNVDSIHTTVRGVPYVNILNVPLESTDELIELSRNQKLLSAQIALYQSISMQNSYAIEDAIKSGASVNMMGLSTIRLECPLSCLVDAVLSHSTSGDTMNASHTLNAIKCIDVLLSSGANPNIADSKGNTPMMRASSIGGNSPGKQTLRAVLERLVQSGANIDAINSDGYTALMDSVISSALNSNNAIEPLLMLGADPLIATKYGENALFLATKFASPECVLLLKVAIAEKEINNAITNSMPPNLTGNIIVSSYEDVRIRRNHNII